MAKPGRKSQADVAAAGRVVDIGQTQRIRPPSHLEGRALEIFEDALMAAGPDHFVQSDVPLLVTYSEAVALKERAQRHIDDEGPVIDGKASPWYSILNRQSKLVSTLSMRLRLSPHSRYDARSASRKANTRRPSPYEGMTDGH